jgi:predicted enzyme related to lactoylglutathione lyase
VIGSVAVFRPSVRLFALLAGAVVCGHAVAAAAPTRPPSDVAVGPQYDSTHVYVAPGDLDAFVASFVATFGGHASKPIVSTVTPTPSSTQFQYIMSRVGTLSTFAYSTPIPYPFGLERTGYLVTDMDKALASARSAGASILVGPFKDPIGMDAIIEWPGGVKMQLYWHFEAPSYEALDSVPENRVYVSPDRIDNFTHAFIHFSRGRVTSDEWHADGAEFQKPGQTFRRITIESKFGKMRIMGTDGQLPFPFGYEVSGYDVANLEETLAKAVAHGVAVLVPPIRLADRRTAMVRFPGGFIAEIHSASPKSP